MRAALAKVETSQASGEAPDFSVTMDLTVAADERPAFRVAAHARVNLMDVDGYRVGRYLVVEYDEARPWRITVLKNASPEWSRRAATAAFDSAPPETRVAEPKAVAVQRRRWVRAGNRSMLAGTAAGLAVFIQYHYVK